ncbi:hypothetical protein BH23CHL8_BH23CHL8_16530 [soil metagenome]
MNLDGIWTWFLDLVGQLLVPAWNDLIQYIPLLLVGLLLLALAALAWWWRRHSVVNRPRVPARLPSGRKPADLHMPGPSLWPFVAPVGLLLMVFSLAVGVTSSLVTLLLMGAGLAIGVVGVLSWYREAGHEYRQLEAGHGEHALLPAVATTAPPAWALEPPEGVHLPGPSAWPFLAPIGLVFAVAGLIFGPALLIGGLVMGTIAVVGWLIDANHELQSVEAHGHAVPATRDPERAFPKALGPVYAAVAGVALAFTLLPWALSFLPAGGAEEVAGPPPTSEPYISASSVTEFEVTEVAVFADEPFLLTFENKQAAVPHNVAVYDSAERAIEHYLGEIFDGPDTRVYEVDPLSAGEYFYVCTVHPPMTGTLYAR